MKRCALDGMAAPPGTMAPAIADNGLLAWLESL